jgi:hypothetical protein
MNLEALSAFKMPSNIELLWDVLLNELHINQTNKDNIRTVFDTNLPIFVSSILNKRNKYSIMDLNKEFLSQVVLAVNKLFPKQNVNVKRITITDEEVGEPYKIEDIHASRQSDFDKELERKRLELETYMMPQKPRELNFSDNMTIDKITSMDSIIAEKITQRNMEINGNYDYETPEHWLKPIETSIKTENQMAEKTKKVSWNEPIRNEPSMNIFNKLKQTPTIDVKQYSEQKSMPLPNGMPTNGMPITEVKLDAVAPKLVTQEPILPNSEIIKQLNETNKRIDNLHEMFVSFMDKMTNNNGST